MRRPFTCSLMCGVRVGISRGRRKDVLAQSQNERVRMGNARGSYANSSDNRRPRSRRLVIMRSFTLSVRVCTCECTRVCMEPFVRVHVLYDDSCTGIIYRSGLKFDGKTSTKLKFKEFLSRRGVGCLSPKWEEISEILKKDPK